MRVFLLSMFLLCAAPNAAANPFGKADGIRFAETSLKHSILPNRPQKRLGNRQAASRAKQRFPDSKVLSVDLTQSGGSPAYRVKMLFEGGVVRYVFVDARNGEVFE